MFLQSSQTNIFTTQTSSMSLAELYVDQDPIEGCFEGWTGFWSYYVQEVLGTPLRTLHPDFYWSLLPMTSMLPPRATLSDESLTNPLEYHQWNPEPKRQSPSFASLFCSRSDGICWDDWERSVVGKCREGQVIWTNSILLSPTLPTLAVLTWIVGHIYFFRQKEDEDFELVMIVSNGFIPNNVITNYKQTNKQ